MTRRPPVTATVIPSAGRPCTCDENPDTCAADACVGDAIARVRAVDAEAPGVVRAQPALTLRTNADVDDDARKAGA